MTQVLVVRDLMKVYGKKIPYVAVDRICFELHRGEILGLLGANGSGKTTTIQMLLGTLKPSAGEIFYFGTSLFQHRSEVLQQVAFASTYTSLPPLLTIYENLRFFGRLYGIVNMEERVQPLLERFGIEDKKHAPVSSLSAGQITRLMLAKAFFIQPRIVLLDEPTASLDPDISRDVCRFLLEERERTGLSIVFTSHKMEEVKEICDRVVFLNKGQVIADGAPGELAKRISSYRLRLTIVDGMKRAEALAQAWPVPYTVEHRVIVFSLDDEKIPPFLYRLMHAGVSYSGIRIEEPSLEAFFYCSSGVS